jgi:hypothetical protein
MNIEELNKVVEASNNEVEHLSLHAEKLSASELIELKKSVLRKYIKNESAIENLVKVNTHTWEISVLLEMDGEEWFTNAVTFLMQEFFEAVEFDKNKVIKIIEDTYPDIHEALTAYHDSFFLQNINRNMKLRHFTRACFRQLGDGIEGTLKPHVRTLFEVLNVNPQNKLQTNNGKVSFGGMITQLCNFEYLKVIYSNALFEVPLSQWRNIAQHASYKVDINTDKITCVYGNKNQHEIIVDSTQLEYLMVIIDKVQTIQKIAVSFMSMELIDEINLSKHLGNSLNNITFETIVGDISLNLSASGFPIQKVRKKGSNWYFESVDHNGKGKQGYATALYSVAGISALMQEKGITPIYVLFSKNGIKLTEAKLGAYKNA